MSLFKSDLKNLKKRLKPLKVKVSFTQKLMETAQNYIDEEKSKKDSPLNVTKCPLVGIQGYGIPFFLGFQAGLKESEKRKK